MVLYEQRTHGEGFRLRIYPWGHGGDTTEEDKALDSEGPGKNDPDVGDKTTETRSGWIYTRLLRGLNLWCRGGLPGQQKYGHIMGG